MWNAIADLRTRLGLTVILTTHYIHETETADQVLIVDLGKELASGTPASLRARYSAPKLEVVPAEGASDEAHAIVGTKYTDGQVCEAGDALHANVSGADAARHVLLEGGAKIRDFQFNHGTMDDVFLNLTSKRVAT